MGRMATFNKQQQRAWKLQSFVAHSANVNCLALGHKSGRVLVTGGDDEKVNLWALGKTACFMSLSGHTTPVDCVQFNQTEELVGAGSRAGALKLWDLEAAKLLRSLNGHKAAVRCMDFHPHGEFLVSGGVDTVAKLWDSRKKGSICTYSGHRGAINSVRFSPDGNWFVSGGEDGAVRLWDLRTGRVLRHFGEHLSAVTQVKFHPHEFLLASGSTDRQCLLYDLETFSVVSCEREVGIVRALCFHPAGECLFVGGRDCLKVLGWEPTTVFDSVPVNWSKVSDIATTQNQLVGASFYQTNVQIFVVDLKKVHPFCPNPTITNAKTATITTNNSNNCNLNSSSPFLCNQSIRKSFSKAERPISLRNPIKLNVKTIEESTSGTDPEEDTTSALVTNLTDYNEIFKGRALSRTPPPLEPDNYLEAERDYSESTSQKVQLGLMSNGGLNRSHSYEPTSLNSRRSVAVPNSNNSRNLEKSPNRSMLSSRIPPPPSLSSSSVATLKLLPRSKSNLDQVYSNQKSRLTTTASKSSIANNSHTSGNCRENVLPPVITVRPNNAGSTTSNDNNNIQRHRPSQVSHNVSKLPLQKSDISNRSMKHSASDVSLSSKQQHQTTSAIVPKIGNSRRNNGVPTTTTNPIVTSTSSPSLKAAATPPTSHRHSVMTVPNQSAANKSNSKQQQQQQQQLPMKISSSCGNNFIENQQYFESYGSTKTSSSSSKSTPSPPVSGGSNEDVNEDGDEEDELIPHTIDRPIGLDIDDFLPKNDRALGFHQQLPDMSEAEVLGALVRGHEPMMAVLITRQRSLKMVLTQYRSKDIKSATESAVAMNDVSILVDILCVYNLKSSMWSLDMCVIILPKLQELLQSKYETYVQTGCATVKLILKHFGNVIKNSIKSPAGTFGVDLSREERYKKSVKCHDALNKINVFLKKKQSIPGPLGPLFREVNTLLQNTFD